MTDSIYQIHLETPYRGSVILRRSGVSKKAWDYICTRFGITNIEPEKIRSIIVEGESDYGQLQLTVTCDR